MVGDVAPLFAKGRGRSVMCSDFLVCHPTSPFFPLNDEEWASAVKKHPNLEDDTGIDYSPRSASASASITLGADYYFTNESILSQFERLFKLLPFKKEFKEHRAQVLVDNATTHTVREYSINEFARGSGTRCPVKSIEWFDSAGKKKTLDCFFPGSHGPKQNKGLLAISQELGLNLSSDTQLNDLKTKVLKHPSLNNVSCGLSVVFFALATFISSCT
jgi:hypothetical protein